MMAVTVGARYVCGGYFGTVRFVGEVPPSEGSWAGVEWDDSTRGKHSGEHNGVQYFISSVPGSASFLRPKKISLGTSFVEALAERYRRESATAEDQVDMYLPATAKGSHITPVELVGAEKITEKQSHLDILQSVSLRGMLVASAGSEGEILNTSPNVAELDLSRNLLLPSMEVVADIVKQLPYLRSLDLSENRQLQLPRQPTALQSFSHLKVLYLNSVCISWPKVMPLLKAMSSLKEFHFCKNKQEHLSGKGDSACMCLSEKLCLLNLEKNQLSSWTQVLNVMQQLPNLETLILNDNQLPKIFFSEGGTCFPKLKHLSLSGNCIHEWSSVHAIGTLPSLVDLKFKNNPLLNDEHSYTARQLMISEIRTLTMLNNSAVSQRERELAERYYLKCYAREAQGMSSSGQPSIEQHPRYTELAAVYGLPEAVQAPSPTATLKDRLIAVTIQCPDRPGLKQLTKKFPSNLSVQKLKGLLQRLYKVDLSELRLSYTDQNGKHEVEMSNNMRPLSFYSIQSGDIILLRW